MKTLKFTIIRQTIEKNHEIYSEGCKQGPSKVTKITNFRKFTKTAIFTIIRQPIHKIYNIYSKGYKEVPNKICENYEFYEIYENC